MYMRCFVQLCALSFFNRAKIITQKITEMKTTILNLFTILLCFSLAFVSCSDEDEITEVLPTDMIADNRWFEDEITSNGEMWFKVSCDAGSTTAYIEWAENEAHGEDRNYSGDVMISAYLLDGVTPYLENKDNGYGEKAKSFALQNNETAFLVKVVPGESGTPGTFALRAKATAVVTVDYTDLELSESWTEGSIAQDEILGFKVKYSGQKKLAVIWAETETPEAGYTADLIVSVMRSDGTTPYKDVDKNKDFLDKNKSHSNDPKYILTDANEKNIKIHVKNTTPGTFGLKVFEVE